MKDFLQITLALVATFTTALHGADWPRFLGPNGNGICQEPGLNMNWSNKAPVQLWRIPLDTEEGYNGPIVVKGVIYILDNKGADGFVRALDLRTGKEIWRFTYPNKGKKNYGFAKSTPVFDNGKIYAIGQMGEVFCLDAGTGHKIWSRELTEFGGQPPKWDYAISPCIDGEKLILCPGGPTSVVALNKATGEPVWKGGGNSKAGYSTPVIATIGGKPQYVIFSGTDLTGVNAENGEVLWSLPWKTSYDINAASPFVFENKVFVSSGYGHGSALVEVSGTQAAIKWENKEILSRFSTPIVENGIAYATGDQKALVCMDIKNGTVRWKGPDLELGGLVGVNNVIIGVNGKTGEIVLFKANPDRYEEFGKFKGLDGRSWTAPIVADGKLIVRNMKELACFDLK